MKLPFRRKTLSLVVYLLDLILCLSIVVFASSKAVGQSFQPPVRSIAGGLGALSQHFSDVFAIADNPAGIAGAPGFSGGIYAGERFMLKELGDYLLVGAYESNTSSVLVQLHYAGSSDYNESSAGLSYARNLGKVRAGIRFNYHRITIGGYGSGATVSGDVSLIWELTPKLRAGIQAINPMPAFFGPDRSEEYPSLYRLGIGYEISDKCFLAGDIIKETGKTVNLSLAFQYQVVSKLLFRIGVNTDTGSPSMSLGWLLKLVRVSITGSYHPDLGFTPGVMLTFLHKPKD